MTMQAEHLSTEEKHALLGMAREAIECAVNGQDLPPLDLDKLPPRLMQDGVCFVTLTEEGGALRGCIGGLEATQPLALDVREHAAAAALEDYRFPQVQSEEVPHLHIEISRLTPPMRLEYDEPQALPGLLRPGVDGVVLRDGRRRATFLPQVWEKISDPRAFLSHLCEKMGAPGDLWQRRLLTVDIYQVEEFHE